MNHATHRDLQNKLENAGFIVDIVRVLKNDKNKDIRLYCLLTLNCICKLSQARLEQTVLTGALPFIIEGLDEPGKMHQICVSLLCSFVSASAACRTHLHKFNILSHLLKLISLTPASLKPSQTAKKF